MKTLEEKLSEIHNLIGEYLNTVNKLTYRDWETISDRKSTRLNSSHSAKSRMPSSA